MATAYLSSSQLNYFDSVIMASIQQLKRWKKGAHLDNIYKEVIKTSDFVSVQIRYLSSRLLTLVQEGKINSKLYRNTVTYIVNPEVLRATKKSLTSTPKTLDCETPVNSEQLASLLVHLKSALQMLLTRKPKNLTLLIRHTPSHF